MTNYITEFNNQIEDFIDFIITICPNDEKDIKNEMYTYKGLFNTTKKMNNVMVLDNYILHVLCYEEHINSRNDSFFLEFDIKKKIKNDEKSVLHIMQLKDIWHKINEKNREKVFDYLIVITYWARLYFNNKFSYSK